MNYQFNLNWSELPEELREEKIDEHIKHSFENGDIEKEIEDQPISLETHLEDQGTRNNAEEEITAHFPIYF